MRLVKYSDTVEAKILRWLVTHNIISINFYSNFREQRVIKYYREGR